MANKNTKKSWDDAENEAKNNFVGWGKIGDYILGTLLSKKQVVSTLPGKEGEMQWIYEVKVKEAAYHILDENKKVVDEVVEPEAGEVVSVGGRKSTDSRMARIKIGQVFGLKFVDELKAKTKGFNPTKVIKVFTPKGDDGEFEMDQEFLAEQEADKDF